jgi:hypothetical protein
VAELFIMNGNDQKREHLSVLHEAEAIQRQLDEDSYGSSAYATRTTAMSSACSTETGVKRMPTGAKKNKTWRADAVIFEKWRTSPDRRKRYFSPRNCTLLSGGRESQEKSDASAGIV